MEYYPGNKQRQQIINTRLSQLATSQVRNKSGWEAEVQKCLNSRGKGELRAKAKLQPKHLLKPQTSAAPGTLDIETLREPKSLMRTAWKTENNWQKTSARTASRQLQTTTVSSQSWTKTFWRKSFFFVK